jgi:GNAT superfamily N-acetyltransferase
MTEPFAATSGAGSLEAAMTARMHTLETRKAALSDAANLSRLTLLLGYDCSEVMMRQRLARLRDAADQGVFVAALDGNDIVGWVHLEVRRPLVSDPYVEILALVVATQHRRLGVGRALADRAIAWAETHHIADIRARAQLHREDALSFYEGLGFELFKEQQVYRWVVAEAVDVNGSPTIVE